MRTRSVVIATALASGLLLTACGSEQVSGAGSGTLPLLRIGSGSAAGVAASADLAGYGSKSGYGRYLIRGTLPSGPSHGSTYLTGRATRADVVRIAAALGLRSTPVPHRHGWVVAGAAGRLAVSDTGQWAFQDAASTCPRFVVDVDSSDGSTGVACAASGVITESGAVGSGPGAPTTTTEVAAPPKPPATPVAPVAPVAPAMPSPATLRSVAGPLLAALGLDPTKATVFPGSDQVSVDPEVAGLPTSGYATDVAVDGHHVTAADGWVYPSSPAPGHTYPLISAAAALKLLASGPEPMMGAPAMACADVAPVPAPASASAAEPAPGMPCGGPSTVTGGRLGLALQWDGGYGATAVLVPAWFLTLRGDSMPLVLVAVSPKYVGSPVPPTSLPNPVGSAGSAPASSGSGGGTTGSSVGPPTSESPGHPSTGS